ncbi:dynein regulatory complex subunit 6 isoform X1 [Etheostoma spectabile]|uniref:dynein regulatory complex subunit 6 isoform X1 n=1 Tax=Etheostoma spectabile TaxID=54343 RepID=UPI0013AED53A|nr:dynein regulatory complex subunit 6 isoform X1 [Etheostoma spectabile]
MCQRQTMAAANATPTLQECEVKQCLPQIYKALLTASCLSCPNDPIQFLKNSLMAFQGHDNLHDVDWHKFVADAEQHTATTSLTVDTVYIDPDDSMWTFCLSEKAFSCYRKHLTSSCFRKWKRFTTQSKSEIIELTLKMDMAKKHHERKCQLVALTKWSNWVKLHKKTQAVATEKLERLVNAGRLERIMAAWCNVAKDSKRTKEYFKRLEMGFIEIDSEVHQIREGCDGLSVLPSSLSIKIFQYLGLRDWLNCAEVCCTWKAIIQSGTLWSQINFSVEKDWITDSTMKQILQTYRPFVIHLNLRGCTSLKWHSLKYISECRNLQDLNLSECLNVTDVMVQKIVEGCPCLLYLNLSCTPITNKTLRELSRSSLNLQYLSLAYCYRFTDKGFMYLNTGKGCQNLIHLNLSGCTQMTVNGFRYISAGCPSLKEIVINDMPTLSDSCVLALIARCCCLSAISLLDAAHLSDVAFKAIAEVAKLKTFRTEGNNQLTDVSWKALCSGSQGLRRLHAAECSRMTDASLKSMAKLKNLQHLDISLCNKVSDTGIQYLTEGFSSTKLRELNVSYCSHITDLSVMRIAQRLCKLYHLNLSYCERLTDVSLEWLSGSSICSLDISGCHIQDQGLAALERIRLKKLVLAECVYITDIGIEKLCKNMRDLEHVDVSDCVSLSDPAIRAISFYCRYLVTCGFGFPKV